MSWVKKASEKINKELGDKCPAEILGEDEGVTEWIPTGLDAVDRHVIGGKGLPVGRIVELYGQPASGKTTLAMTAAIACQKMGGVVIWAETEEAMDQYRFSHLGGNVDDVLLMRPETVEDFGHAALVALGTVPAQGPTLLVWDSVAATQTRAELEGGLEGAARIGDKARAIGQIMRVLSRKLPEARACLLAVNQVRQTIGAYIPSEVTPGGNAIKFHASVRLKLMGGTAVKGEHDHIGKVLKVMAEKTRWAPPFRKVEAKLVYLSGWDNDWTTINLAKDLEIIKDSSRVSADNLVAARSGLGW